MAFDELLQQARRRADTALEAWLPSADTVPVRLHEAMRYAVFNGGKRVRPLLVYATGEVLGIAPGQLDGPACALELIHAYSLVHDDLPAMDDDDLRRGKPTCHKAFDEATAILVGDALQSLAFEVLAGDPAMAAPPAVRVALIKELALAAGSRGMCGGQAIDMAAVGVRLSLTELQTMHAYKTGALIRSAVRLAALSLPELSADQHARLDRYAEAVGLAFQIRDDILDVEADTATLGKPQGSDAERDKPTYTSLLGLDGAKQKARDLHTEAVEALAPFGTAGDPLRWIADYIVERAN